MQFRIADTFTASLANLSGEEQKAVKTTAFDLQMNPAHPGFKLHQIERAKDKSFWSARVSRDIRLIVHKTATSFLLCYVDHHDAAYQWAVRRRLEQHPVTGAAQLVEIRETVREIEVPVYVDVDKRSGIPASVTYSHTSEAPILAGKSDDELLSHGVPVDWLGDVRSATEDTLLDIAGRLPAEAAEALLQLATGGMPIPLSPMVSQDVPPGRQAILPRLEMEPADMGSEQTLVPPVADPFEHPDAQRRFRVVANVEELERALEYPWEKWTVFLHPVQRAIVERDYSGPARVSGSAGTGKTVVALHRAVHLARAHPSGRVLLATFSDTLASALHISLRRLIGNEPVIAERLEVHSMSAIGRWLYTANFGKPDVAVDNQVRALLDQAASDVGGHRFSTYFLWTEWRSVVDAWQLRSWEAYRDVPRLGRKTRLGEAQRALLWSIFSRVRSALAAQGLVTEPAMFARVSARLAEAKQTPFDFCVIDEAQDIGVAELRFLAALGGGRPNSLFLAGDLGQRIFQTPFSWRSLGVDVRGRSHTLRVNYRTSHQIRRQADRLLPPELSDVDGNPEQRRGTVSVFNGLAPEVRTFQSAREETSAIVEWLRARHAEAYAPHEIGVFVRSPAQAERAVEAVREAGLTPVELDRRPGGASGSVAVGTMHLAKGLEFRAVAVVACDDDVIPLQSRIETVADEADLEDVYATERHLLYVACTRARDCLLVTGVDPASEFLDDLRDEA